MHAFSEGTDEFLGRRLQWHTIAAAQLSYIVDGRMKELAKDAEREKALKDVAEATAKEKMKHAEDAVEKVAVAEKAQALAEGRSTELEVQLGGTEFSWQRPRV
nr:uncharacterized protein LOC112031153 [Quercus suber]